MPKADDIELSPEEAESIARHARDGRLDTDDPEIRRVVAHAQRTAARHAMWGDTPRPRRRMIMLGALAFLALWVIGLAVPFIVTFGLSR